MALTGTDRGSGNNNVSGTTFTLSPSGNFAAGSMAVIVIATDNAGASGAGFSTFTVTDGLGNTWTRRTSPLYDPGAASAGVEGAIFTTLQNGGTLQSSTVITVTFNNASVAKAWALHEIIPTSNQFSIQYKTGANSVGSATGTPTITTSSINVGDVVIGGGMAESADTWAGDADATNGSWSTHQHAAAGTGATGMSVTSQRKVVTATATQTYNPTLTSADVILSWIQLHEIGIRGYGQTQADIKATSIGSGQAQADIKAVGRGSGQAQASLLVDRYPIAVMADGPISYWRLGEPSGTLAVDMKGNNDGTYENTPILGVTGALVGDADTAITLEGTDQDVDVLDSTSLDFGDIFSIEGWFKRGVIGILQALSDKGATGGTGPLVFFASDNKLRLATSGAGVAVVQSSNSITDLTTWHHFVVTKNGAAASVYIDGIDVSVAQTPATFSNTTNHFRIGRETNASSFFNGSIDEYAVYNYALTPTQVLNHYIAGVDGTNRYGQAQARIKALGVNAFGQSQADIKQTYTVSGQALAFISPFRGYGQANALVNGIFTQVIDTFTRSVTDGLGTANTGGTYTRIFGTAADADVNGTEATIKTSSTSDYLTHLNSAIVGNQFATSIKFRFKVDIVPDTSYSLLVFEAGLGTRDTTSVGYNSHIDYNLSTNNFELYTGANGSTSQGQTITSNADTWYQVETTLTRSSNGQIRSRGKIYQVGNTPSNYVQRTVTHNVLPGHIGLSVFQKSSGNLPLISIDDLEIVDAGWTESGQAQAQIKQTYTQLAQAQADIKQTYFGLGQAQSEIKRTYTDKTGQSQADIKATSNAFGQVNSDIKATNNGFGQSNADIKATSTAYGQSNADIKATSNSFGQAQADIKAVSRGLGQAQASILTTSNQFAQANAYILGINYNSGQAQTYIAYNYLLDTFTRTVSAGAGTADTGNIWTTPNDPIYVNVDGSKLILNIENDQRSTIFAPTTQIKGLTGIEYNFEFSILNFPPIDSYPLYNIFHIEHEKTLNDGQIQYYIELRIYEDGLIITLMSSYNSDAIPPQVTVFGHISRLIIPEEILHIQWVTFAEILKSYLIIKADNGDILSVSALENNLTYTAHTPSITYYSSIASPSSVYLDNLEIKGINYTIRFGQAQAYIRAFNVNKSGQSQARVRGDGALIWLKDTFTRTESGTWGTPDIGPTYTYEQNFGNLIVSGGKGAVSTLTNSSEYIYVVSPIFQSDVDYSIDFEFSGNATNDHYLEFGIRADEPIGNFYIDAYIYQLDLTHFELGISDSESLFSSVNIEVSSTTSVPMKLKMRANGNEILLKTWEASLAEPDWQINATTEDLEYGIAWLTINVRDIGGITSYPFVDNWYITEVLDLHPAQAQAFISKSAGYGQAQAKITPQYIYFLDTFTRVIAPTDSDPATLGQPDAGQYNQFFADYNNTAFSSGSRLESSINTAFSFLQLDTPVALLDQTISMDFYADIYDSESYNALYFINNNFTGIDLTSWQGNLTLHNTINAQSDNITFVPINGTIYRLRLHISPTIIRGKVWDTSTVEPDWQLFLPPYTDEFVKTVFYTQTGTTNSFPFTIVVDNLSIYSPNILPGVGQARASIKAIGVEGLGQAQARINAGGALVWFKDTFTRTVDAPTPGTPDIGTYSIEETFGTNFVIDGNKLVLATSNTGTNKVLFARTASIAYNTDTTIQFTVPITFVDVDAILVEIRARDYSSDVSAYVYFSPAENILYLYVDSGANSAQTALGTLQYGVTYNLKLRANNNHILAKLWTELNEEPEWLLEAAFIDNPPRFGNGNSFDIDLQQLTLGAIGQINIDNFLVTEVLNLHPGQAQALIEIAATVGCGQAQGTIKHTYFQHGQSQALISGSAAQFGQAQGKIKAIGVNNCGQTQADIKATSIQLGQANVSIKQTYPLCTGEQSGDFVLGEDSLGDIPGDFICIGLFGQAQAAIVVTSKVCGQTQADIKHTYTQSGQAQADIKATSVQFGQAQSDIKQTYVQSGQAQVLISITTTVSAQAQGRILQTYNQSGQAQGSIKQSYIICGQSQGQIKSTYQSFGQAQAYILLLQQVYGQSRAEIKSTYNQSANTQARILNTYSNSGNAQSVILTDVNIYAQTQAYIKATSVQNGQAQANIISVNSEVAQAQAQILATSIVTGQAEAFILKSAGYGQARAYVIITIFFGTLEISDSNPINVVLSDEIDVGPTEEDSESFTLVLEDGSFDIILEDSNITIILEDSNY